MILNYGRKGRIDRIKKMEHIKKGEKANSKATVCSNQHTFIQLVLFFHSMQYVYM